MKPLPLPVRLAAGLVVTARERAKDLPRQLIGLPITVVSHVLQTSMRVQQHITELALKGDEALSGLRPVEDTPSWATFDEDVADAPGEPFTGQLVSVPAPRAEHNGAGPLTSARNSMFDRADAGETDEADEGDDDRSPDPWEEEAREVAARDADPSDDPDQSEGPRAPEWLPNYDQLTLAQLRARLRQFSAEQLAELLAYEKATSNRPSYAGMLQRRIERVSGGDSTL
ncbi:lipid droplet-associated protein [Thermocrispum municipale]|uniref:lipid droplet-associated protein n=1 Tax=Thermocrispum municipale TaxID=37926 RepID=UPI00040466CE|nr:lipid droplet-associated protein [Thermocrispum municipale]